MNYEYFILLNYKFKKNSSLYKCHIKIYMYIISNNIFYFNIYKRNYFICYRFVLFYYYSLFYIIHKTYIIMKICNFSSFL